jgi:hypothetical protein
MESEWRVIHVLATRHRNLTSRWPFFGGSCITWSSTVIAVGWDFAESVLHEQIAAPASRDNPVEVAGGRLHDAERRAAIDVSSFARASEILSHECGHTAQARRFGPVYLPIAAVFTWWREGLHWWNWFENQASEIGQFGGIISGSVHPDLWAAVRPNPDPNRPNTETT